MPSCPMALVLARVGAFWCILVCFDAVIMYRCDDEPLFFSDLDADADADADV